MPEIANLTSMTAQELFDFHYTDDRPVYLLIDGALRLVENMQHHTEGTTYIGGGFDVLLEGDEEYRYIDKYADVYLDEHYVPINILDDDAAYQGALIDALLGDDDDWTVTVEAHELPPDMAAQIPPGVKMWHPGDPIPELRIGPTRVDIESEDSHDQTND